MNSAYSQPYFVDAIAVAAQLYFLAIRGFIN